MTYRLLLTKSDIRNVFSIALIAVGLANPALAQADGFQAALSETGVWDSNPLMRGGAKDLYGITSTPKLTYASKTATSYLGIETSADNNVFNQRKFNTTDYHAATTLKKSTQRLEVSLNGNVDYDTTRTSELSTFGLDSGVVRRLGYAVAPGASYKLSPVSSLETSGSYAKSQYDSASYTDYHTLSLSSAYQRSFTELYVGAISLNARRYQADGGLRRRVDSAGPTAALQAVLSPEWTGQIRAGAEASREEQRGTLVQDWAWSAVFSSDLTYKTERDVLRFSAVRAQQSYANGNDDLLTSISVREERNISPTLTISLGGSFQFSDNNEVNSSGLDKKYVGEAGLSYHITKSLDMTSHYRFRQETYTNRSDKPKQNVVRFGLTYRPTIDVTF